MGALVSAAGSPELPEQEFRESLKELRSIFERVLTGFIEAAGLLAPMSSLQIRAVKREFRGFVTADHIDRLALLGRELISEWLAQPSRVVSASMLKRREVRDALNDPEKLVDFYDPGSHRVLPRRVGSLNGREVAQVLTRDGKIRTPKQQQRWLQEALSAPKALPEPEETYVFEGARAAGDEGCVLIYGRFESDEANTRRCAVRVPLKTLRRLAK